MSVASELAWVWFWGLAFAALIFCFALHQLQRVQLIDQKEDLRRRQEQLKLEMLDRDMAVEEIEAVVNC